MAFRRQQSLLADRVRSHARAPGEVGDVRSCDAPQSPVAHGLVDPDAAVPAPTPQARWRGQGPVVAVVSLAAGLGAAFTGAAAAQAVWG
ncbi:hypothetical protein ACU686_10735 [Yinghuangia aomiensis]